MQTLPEITRSPSLSVKAKLLLQKAIWSGQLELGQRLVETQLAEQFQISRGPLREALQSLAAEGLIESHPGRGTSVVNPTLDQLQDMIVLRAMLGGLAARYVAAQADPSVCIKLSESLEKMRAAAKQTDEAAFFDEHWAFFEIMHRASNEFIFRSWQSLYGLVNIYVRRLGRPYVPLNRIITDCACFVRTFKAGDADEAEAIVRSEMLSIGFIVLQRPIPDFLQNYVTRRVRSNGTVVRT